MRRWKWWLPVMILAVSQIATNVRVNKLNQAIVQIEELDRSQTFLLATLSNAFEAQSEILEAQSNTFEVQATVLDYLLSLTESQ